MINLNLVKKSKLIIQSNKCFPFSSLYKMNKKFIYNKKEDVEEFGKVKYFEI